MRKFITIITMSIITLVMMTSSNKAFTIYLIGDSTMANKDIEKEGRERGWGMALQGFFAEEVYIDNRALNGRSSKSFIDEGHWQKVLDDIKPGDYLVIQFGHNDEKGKIGDKRHTIAGLTFDDNIRMFCRGALGKGATPIVMNPVVRCEFTKRIDRETVNEARSKKGSSDDVNIENSEKLKDTHGAYAVTPKYVARELRVPFVDATGITASLESRLGPTNAKLLHMLSADKKGKDTTHYTEYGAHRVAELLVDAMAEACPELKPYVRHYDFIVSAKGFGNYLTLQAAINNVPIYAKSTICVLDGEWKEPKITSGKKIKYVKFSGAKVE